MNSLTNAEVSQEDIDRALFIWKVFNCQNIGDYHDIYLVSDVLLLTEVFEKFRTMSLEIYHLDPVYYYSAPNLAWDAMLRVTGV